MPQSRGLGREGAMDSCQGLSSKALALACPREGASEPGFPDGLCRKPVD